MQTLRAKAIVEAFFGMGLTPSTFSARSQSSGQHLVGMAALLVASNYNFIYL